MMRKTHNNMLRYYLLIFLSIILFAIGKTVCSNMINRYKILSEHPDAEYFCDGHHIVVVSSNSDKYKAAVYNEKNGNIIFTYTTKDKIEDVQLDTVGMIIYKTNSIEYYDFKQCEPVGRSI